MNEDNYKNLRNEMEKLNFVDRVEKVRFSSHEDEIYVFCDDELSFYKINKIVNIGRKYNFQKRTIFTFEAGENLAVCLGEVVKNE